MKGIIAALAIGIAAAPAAAATKERAPDGSHILVHETVVDAAPADVWAAVSTAEGWKSWAVPVAWEEAGDTIEASYTPTARPGDPSTIRQQVLLRLPKRLMVFRTVKAPERFPDFETYAKVVSAFEIEPAGEGRSRVRLTGTGYEDSEAGRRLLAFFEKGNQVSLDALKARFAKAAVAPPLRPELEPMRYLLGHCWSGRFKNGAVDTHCFESVYGGQHVRDRHEVKGPDGIYRGETLYSWDNSMKRVDYTYWNSLGGVSRGAMAPKGDHALDFGRETHTGRDGRKTVISTLWRKVGTDSYESVSTSGADPTGSRVVRYTRVD